MQTKRTVDPGVLAPYLWPVEQHYPPKQLSSGNAQIAKGDGDMPVQSYLDAMPGWKSRIGHQLDRIVAHACPGARKAVRWNTPLYGKEDGWFFSICFYKAFVQLSFFRGVDLVPVPPGRSKVDGMRYFNIHENDALDENLIAGWISQAGKLPSVKFRPSGGGDPNARSGLAIASGSVGAVPASLAPGSAAHRPAGSAGHGCATPEASGRAAPCGT